MDVVKAGRMAKKKGAGKAGGGKVPVDRWKSKPLALQVRGSAAWEEWLERLAKFARGTKADVADRAIAAYARQIGFAEEPPER